MRRPPAHLPWFHRPKAITTDHVDLGRRAAVTRKLAAQLDGDAILAVASDDRRLPAIFPVGAGAVDQLELGNERYAVERWLGVHRDDLVARNHVEAKQVGVEKQRVRDHVVAEFGFLVERGQAHVGARRLEMGKVEDHVARDFAHAPKPQRVEHALERHPLEISRSHPGASTRKCLTKRNCLAFM